jgi:hypothetical protein
MANESQKGSIPGRFGSIKVAITMSGILVVLVVVAGLLYAMHPDWHSTMDFFGVGFGMAAAVLSAYYVGKGLQISIQQRDEAVTDARISRAFVYIDAWDQPNLSKTRHVVREFVDGLEVNKTPPDQVAEKLRGDKAMMSAVLDILNFFEGFALAVNLHNADEESLRRCFRGLLLEYYSNFEGFIKALRSASNRPMLFKELEDLAKYWTSNPTSQST